LAWLSQAAFFVCAWLLARRLMPTRLALLSVGLLAALPSAYAPHDLFSYVEDFLTPRQMAEALVLASLAATLARRYLLTGLCLLAAGLLHPIMTLAGIVMLLGLAAIERPRLVVTAAGLLVLVSLLSLPWLTSGPFTRIDTIWLQLVLDLSSYLLISNWSLQGWEHLTVYVAILAVGSLKVTEPTTRKLCRAALLLGGAAIATTLIYCDWLHLLLAIQVQPWRWLWLLEVVSVVALPLVIIDCWRAGTVGRATALLLVNVWIVRDTSAVLAVATLAIVCAAAAKRLEGSRGERAVLLGAILLLILGVGINIEPKLDYLAVNQISLDPTRLWLPERLELWLRDGVACAAVLVGVFVATERVSSRPVAILLPSVLLVGCAFLIPPAWGSWTTFHYTAEKKAQFAAWRAAIPAQAESLWPGSPVGAWYLLERPSYYARVQAAGDIFSRQKAFEVRHRAQLLAAALGTSSAAPIANADDLREHGLELACEDPALSFVVSWKQLGESPVAPIAPQGARPGAKLRLYRCADVISVQNPSHSVTSGH
jgi:hypothetical protein